MADLLHLNPDVARRVGLLKRAARARGLDYVITSAFRSRKQQQRLYAAWLARGRTGLPAARPGLSTHEYGLAVDLVMRRGALADLVRLAGCVGLVWAGKADPVHFDVFGPTAWRVILAGGSPTVRYSC